MTELIKQPLGNYIKIKNGYAFKSSNFVTEGIPITRMKDLKNGPIDIKKCVKYPFDSKNQFKNYELHNGDILIGMSGSIGKIGIIKNLDGKAFLNQRVGKYEILDKNKLLKEFLYYIIISDQYQKKIDLIATGVTQKNISSKQLESIKVYIPDFNNQKKIVEILERAEKLKEWRVEADELADDYLDSAFHSIFGDPIKNEENWEVKKLSYVADVVSGVTKGRKLQNKETLFAPYLRVANVQDGYLDLDEIKEIEVLTTDVEKYKLFEGDIVLTEGGDPDKLGRGAVWHNEVPNCIHQNHIFRVRLKNDDLNPTYLSKLIGSLYGKLYFLKSAKQTTGIASINSTQLKKFPVIIPPIELQNQFADIVQQVESLKNYQSQSKQEIDNLFNTLMQKAFKGELVC